MLNEFRVCLSDWVDLMVEMGHASEIEPSCETGSVLRTSRPSETEFAFEIGISEIGFASDFELAVGIGTSDIRFASDTELAYEMLVKVAPPHATSFQAFMTE